MGLHSLRLAKQYLFGRYQDHKKFFNTKSILDDDGGLFVAILERASADSKRTQNENIARDSYDLSENEDGKVDPIRLATAHVVLKELKDHSYNAFESIFLSSDNFTLDTPTSLLGAWFNFFGSFLCTWFSIAVYTAALVVSTIQGWKAALEGEEPRSAYVWSWMALISFVSFGYYFLIIGQIRFSALKFNDCVKRIALEHENPNVNMVRNWTLRSNFLCNVVLAHIFWLLNPVFIMSGEKIVDSILNAVATAFILDVDDHVRPFSKNFQLLNWNSWFDWGLDSLNDSMPNFVKTYVIHKDKSSNGRVSITKVKGEDIEFQESDYCIFAIEGYNIKIFRDNGMTSNSQPTKYEQVTYRVEGVGAKSFLEDLSQFDCVEKVKVSGYIPI